MFAPTNQSVLPAPMPSSDPTPFDLGLVAELAFEVDYFAQQPTLAQQLRKCQNNLVCKVGV